MVRLLCFLIQPIDCKKNCFGWRRSVFYQGTLVDEPNIAKVAGIIGDPRRAKMLLALMGGKALTAGELAFEADITAQTASSHLQKLVEQQFILVEKQGRHKYFQLAGTDVAELIESFLTLTAKLEKSGVATGPKDPEMRKSRICYDHLAGETAVLMFDSFIERGLIDCEQHNLLLNDKGKQFFERKGANICELIEKPRPLCKSCLDWSERRHHLAGSLGKWLLNDMLSKNWAQKDMDTRVVRFSENGYQKFLNAYEIE